MNKTDWNLFLNIVEEKMICCKISDNIDVSLKIFENAANISIGKTSCSKKLNLVPWWNANQIQMPLKMPVTDINAIKLWKI